MQQHKLNLIVDVVQLKCLNNLFTNHFLLKNKFVILYALTHGFLDDVPVNDILAFEEALYDYFDAHYESIFETIRTTKDLPEESVLDAAIKAFKDQSEFK